MNFSVDEMCEGKSDKTTNKDEVEENKTESEEDVIIEKIHLDIDSGIEKLQNKSLEASGTIEVSSFEDFLEIVGAKGTKIYLIFLACGICEYFFIWVKNFHSCAPHSRGKIN